MNNRYVISYALDGSFMVLDTAVKGDFEESLLFWGLTRDQADNKAASLNKA